MALLDYIAAGESPSAARMNAAFTALDAKMQTMLGGRSLVLALKFPNTLPSQIFGKPFFFNDGKVVYYSATVPDAPTYTVNVTDPVTLASVQGIGVRSYSQTAFDAVLAGVADSAITFDTAFALPRATIPLIASGSYPSGITQQTGVGLFQHSLRVMTRLKDLDDGEGVRRFYVKELSPGLPTVKFEEPFPERRSDYGVAELSFENLTTATLPADWPKYRFYRFHNLSGTACVVSLFGQQVTLAPFEERSIRYDFTADFSALENPREPMRYFFKWEQGDPLMFWCFAGGAHSRDVHGQYVISDRSTTPEASMQGNNICNPAGVYDLIRFFTPSTNHAQFGIDPHELCDIDETYYGLLPAIKRTGTEGSYTYSVDGTKRFGDLLFHTGRMVIAKTLKVAPFTCTLTAFQFNGFDTITEDFASAGITCTTLPNGDLRLTVTDADYFWDLVGTQCNLLKDKAFIGGDRNEAMLRTAVRLNSEFGGWTIDAFAFETIAGTAASVDPLGENRFNRAKESNYRLTRRTSTTTTPTLAWLNPSGAVVTASGVPIDTLAEESLTVPAKTFPGLKLTTCDDVLSLQFHGHPTAGVGDAWVSYAEKQLRLTPEGVVLTFIERVSAAALPVLTSPAYRSAYTPTGQSYTFNAALNCFEFKHAVRFRKHGFGYGQHGKNHAAFFPPHNGRMTVNGWRNTGTNSDGRDFEVPREKRRESGIKTLRHVALYGGDFSQGPYALFPVTVHELETLDGRFWTVNSPVALDGLMAFDGQPASWYAANREALTGDDYPAQFGGHRSLDTSRRVFLTLSAEHINGIIQAINQIKEVRPLDFRAFVAVVGNKFLSFDTGFVTPIVLDPSHIYGMPAASWSAVFGTVPAPVDALLGRGDSTYWPAFLASRGIAEVTSATAGAMPASWATYRTAPNENRTARAVATVTVTGPARAGDFYLTSTSGGQQFWNLAIHATAQVSVADPTVSTPTAAQTGYALNLATATPSDPMPLPNASLVNLATAYNGKRWLRASDLSTFFAAIGFPFVFSEVMRPLKLEALITATELAPGFDSLDGTHKAITYQGQIAHAEIASVASYPNPALIPASLVNSRVNGKIGLYNNKTRTNTYSLLTWRSKVIAFRLAETAAETEWKIAVTPTGPLECYHMQNRTPGRWYWLGPDRCDVHVGVTTRDFEPTTADPFGASWQVVGGYTPSDPFFPQVNNFRPFAVAGDEVSSVTVSPSSCVIHAAAGPRLIYNLAPTADEGAERLYQHHGGEVSWFATYIVTSTSASMPVVQFGSRRWGRVLDWRDESLANEMSYRGSAESAASTGQVVEPSESNPAANSATTVAAGVTMFRPARGQSFRLLYDPLRLRVSV